MPRFISNDEYKRLKIDQDYLALGRKCKEQSEQRIIAEEMVMQSFILMCQQSLDPPRYEAFLDICEHLCDVRKQGLRPDSLRRCLGAVYVPPSFDLESE